MFLTLLFAPGFLSAQILKIFEAEAASRTQAFEGQPGPNIWASNGSVVAGWWGNASGDSLSWTEEIRGDMSSVRMAIRYSYEKAGQQWFWGSTNDERIFHLIVNDEIIPVKLPDTGSWDHFETVDVALPDLKAGRHRFTLLAPQNHLTVNVDAFAFFRGQKSNLPPGFQSTVVAESSNKRFVLKLTADANLTKSVDQVFTDFNAIYNYFQNLTGWEPRHRPVVIHLYTQDSWPRPGTTAFRNDDGVHFTDHNFEWDVGNMVHEMNHVFHNDWFPDWIDHPIIRTNDAFDSIGSIFPRPETQQTDINIGFVQARNIGMDLISNPQRKVEDPHQILYALRIIYGEGFLPGFYRRCFEMKISGEIIMEPGHRISNADILRAMSAAAGEDVEPVLSCWTGWRK